MTDRHLVITTALLVGFLAVATKAVEPNGEMLPNFHRAEASKYFEARKKAIAAIQTPADLAKRQAAMQAFFLQALGEFPAKTDLNPVITGTLQRDGYRVEKVIYESRPHHRVTANLYIPTNRQGKMPGILMPCGHSQNGKAAETYQQISILLAKRGFVVLCTDPIGQGERLQWVTTGGKPGAAGSTAEHTLLHTGSLLLGGTAANYRLWDEIRGLDYLETRPEVDGSKLGVTGNSGGGTLTAYIMAVDDRVAAAAASCYITSFERLFNTIGPQDGEQNVTGQVAAGFDHADFLTIRAPKPTMMCVGTKDFFDIDGSWSTFREVKNLYGILGHAERVDLFESNEPHGFTAPRRDASARFLTRWLYGIEATDTIEPVAKVEADADLACTKSGQVLIEFPDEVSAFAINIAKGKELAQARQKLQADALRSKIKKLIRYHSPNAAASVSTLTNPELTLVTTEPGIVVPCSIHQPTEKKEGIPVRLVLGESMQLTEPDRAHLAKGGVVVKLDPRGMGMTTPGSPKASTETPEAFLALHLDQPLLGRRVFDVQTVITALFGGDKTPIELVGVGPGGPVTLHVAALDDRVSHLSVVNSITSWDELLTPEGSKNQLANVVPKALLSYDLGDLIKALGGKVTISR